MLLGINMCLVGGNSNLIGDEYGAIIERHDIKPIICNCQVLPHMVSILQRDNIYLDQNCKEMRRDQRWWAESDAHRVTSRQSGW